MNERKDTPERVRATQDLRKSNAAGTHGDKRTKRLRTRSAITRKALRDSE